MTGLYMLLRALLAGGVSVIMMMGYGMKMPIDELLFVDELKTPWEAPPARYDIGRNIDSDQIPLFIFGEGAGGFCIQCLGTWVQAMKV